ncbi:MAG: RNase adapter RapZ [Clostridiales bacterium]|nr:RNase adapter RapZ [Clostridiales bacterium]
MEFIIVTGLSGAGKSRAVNVLEDIGFYCVDNMPPKLLPKFAELCLQSQDKLSRVALVIDVRGGRQFEGLLDSLDELKRQGGEYKILFLECSDQVLARRYKETRRQHPLAASCGGSVIKAIELERTLLKAARARTDYLIDTSYLSPAQLRERLVGLFLGSEKSGMQVQCMSFGFKYGYPAEADLVLDVRCLPNPFYVDELKHKTGLDQDVRDYVLDKDVTKGFQTRLYSLIDYLLPLYSEEGKSQLVVAIGCTGGKHRSVALAEELARHVADQGIKVAVNHRDIGKL